MLQEMGIFRSLKQEDKDQYRVCLGCAWVLQVIFLPVF